MVFRTAGAVPSFQSLLRSAGLHGEERLARRRALSNDVTQKGKKMKKALKTASI